MVHSFLLIQIVVFAIVAMQASAFMQKAVFGARVVRSATAMNEFIGKGQLADIIKGKTDIDKKDVEIVLNALFETVQEKVFGDGKEIRIQNFGTFKQKKTAARSGRNPKTGEPLVISASTSVAFSPSTTLKKKTDGEVPAKK